MQRANSASGTTGYVKLTVAGSEGEIKIDFDCPYIGSNKCNIGGSVSGLTHDRIFFSGSSGHIASCVVMIKDD